MRSFRQIAAACLLVGGCIQITYAADLNIVLLDSKSGHPLHGKLVCIAYPAGGAADRGVVQEQRACHRTDSAGVATFTLPDPAPDKVNVELATNNLVPCFASQAFPVAPAMKDGSVIKNTCGGPTTDTAETGELVLYGHQKSIREVLGTARNEF